MNQSLSYEQRMVMMGIGFSCDLVNIIGNIGIGVIVYKQNRFQSTPSKLLLNQAIADASVGMLSFIHIATKANTDVARVALRTVVFIFYCESMQTLGAQSLTLWFAICYPVKFKIHNTTSKVCGFIAGSWILNIAFALLLTVADETYHHTLHYLFSFNRHSLSGQWYEVLRFLMMFLPPLVSVISFIKVRIFKRKTVASSSLLSGVTKQLVNQSLGIHLVSSIYLLAFLLQIVGDHFIPLTGDYQYLSFVMTYLVYMHLVLKLPLFLALFKPYRQLARVLCCRCKHRIGAQPPGQDTDSTGLGTLP